MPSEQRQKDYDATIAGLRKAGNYKVIKPAPEPPPELGLIGKYSPAVVRGIGGLIGSAPGIGAVAGGVSELGAEGLENYFGTRDDLSWQEVGAATALGAMGGGMVSAIGHSATPAIAALRAGSLGAASPFVRSAIVDHDMPDWGDVALQGGVAALTGGAIKHLTGRLGKVGTGKTPTPAAPTGLSRLLSNGEEVASKEVPLKPAPPLQREGTPSNINLTTAAAAEKGGNRIKTNIKTRDQKFDQLGRALGQDIQAGRREFDSLEDSALKQRSGELTLEGKEAAKLAEQKAAQAEIDAATQQGMVPKESISESFTEKVPGGNRRLSRRFVQPAEEEAAGSIRGTDDPLDIMAGLKNLAPKAEASAPLAGRYAGLARPEGMPEGVKTLEDLLQARPGPVHIDELAHLEPSPGAAPAVEGVKDRRVAPRGTNPETNKAAQFQFGLQRLDAAAEAAGVTSQEYTGLLREMDAGAHPDQLAQKIQQGWRPAAQEAAPQVPQAPQAPTVPQGPDYSGMGAPEQFIPSDALRRSPGDVAGEHYRNLKGLLAGGEIMPKEAPRVAGRALRRIGDAEQTNPLATHEIAAEARAGAPPVAPTAAPTEQPGFGANASDSLKDFFRGLSREGPRPGRPGAIGPSRGGGSGWGGQGGFMDPALMSRMALGAGGALLGGAINQDDPVAGALLGGAAGAILPSMVAKFSQHLPDIFANPGIDQATKATLSSLGTPEGIKDAITQVVNRIPAYLRANLLYSPNLLNNTVTGPYGAAVMAAMERAGAGDPRGAMLLQQLSPNSWGAAFARNLEAASSRVAMSEERAGGSLLSEASNPFDKYTAFPGTIMTAGDLATRELGMAAGFTEDEMRAFTLTSEPETAFGKTLANIPRSGGMIGQTFAPFMRTAVNSMEQGAFRTPGAGYLFQALRETPDEMGVQHMQQLMGVGAGIGGYELGQHEDELANSMGGNDPTFNPMLRKLISGFGRNVAGPYSTIASAGYAGGKAFDKTSDAQKGLKGAMNAYINEAPLPSASIPLSYINAIADPTHANLPSGFVPQALKDYLSPKGGTKRPQRPKRPGS